MANRDAIEPNARRVHPALIGAVVLAVIVIVFVLQNTHRVPVHFLWVEWIAAAELFTVYLRHRRDT